MKLNKIIYISLLLFVFFISCKEDMDYKDNSKNLKKEDISGLKISLTHKYLIADGRAEIKITPRLYKTNDSIVVLNDRLGEDWIKYYDQNDNEYGNVIKISDQSKVGQKISIHAKVNDLVSDPVEFEIIAPVAEEYQEVTYPVVFHIVRTKEDIYKYGNLRAQKVYDFIDKMNRAFSGEISNNAVGVNTKIKFVAAKFDPNGNFMAENGINRVEVEEISPQIRKDKVIDKVEGEETTYKYIEVEHTEYDSLVMENKINWNPEKYLNIYVLASEDSKMGDNVSKYCKPEIIYKASEGLPKPEGINFITDEVPEEIDYKVARVLHWSKLPGQFGVKIPYSILNETNFVNHRSKNNTVLHYLGVYFGLLPTYGYYYYYGSQKIPEDYCEDTFGTNTANVLKNILDEDEENILYSYLSENIMDDPTGLHRSVSKDQLKRIRWIIENCPARAAWKSKFALTGQE